MIILTLLLKDIGLMSKLSTIYLNHLCILIDFSFKWYEAFSEIMCIQTQV